ncbi:MAG: DUF5591 domain-containing protein [Candidatus Thermoplasmatota archaeon]
MIEVMHRCWLAKTARWEFIGQEFHLPQIAFFSSARHSPPSDAELTCGPKGLLTAQGSILSPDCAFQEGMLPPFDPFPMGCEDAASLRSDGAVCLLQGQGWHDAPVPRAELYVLVNAAEMHTHPREFAQRLAGFAELAPRESVLYAPACATPANLAVLVYCGVGLVDNIRGLVAARLGMHTWHGGDMPADPYNYEGLAASNSAELQREMERISRYIEQGRLREYAEYKAAADPMAQALLRHMDLRHYDAVEHFVPVAGPRFNATSSTSLHRPDVVRWQRRILERYRPPVGVETLLLLPCSAKKPYSMSRSHALFKRALRASGCEHVIHEVIVTSPLGLVPRELEAFYPAREYDVPVTGDWTMEERHRVLTMLRHFINVGRYRLVVLHLGAEAQLLKDEIEAFASTGGEDPTSREALADLAEVLRTASGGKKMIGRMRLAMNALSMARFQFGDAGALLAEQCEIEVGRGHLRFVKDGEHVASYSQQKGQISLTMAGGRLLAQAHAWRVQIDDFMPQGSVFVSGVLEVDPEIRAGDEVVVVHGDDLRAIGTAKMSAAEISSATKGEAVRIRKR